MAGLILREGDLVIRRMRDEDADHDRMAAWLNAPHVREWWDPDDPPATRATVATKYGPRAQGASATTSCVIELDGRAVGYVQFYRWDVYPEEVAEMGLGLEPGTFGLDILIGEPDMVGAGVGSRVVDSLARHLHARLGATAVALATEVTNARAIRAYEKAGLVRVRRVLDSDTRGGERVEAWLMVRSLP